MRITVDRDRCIGSGNCSFYAPATFDLDDELKVVVRGVGGDLESDVRAAADGCPVRAITIEPPGGADERDDRNGR
jgi:ferredoxin